MSASESKNDRFRRLAVARMNAALKQLKLIENLANRNNYEWTDEEAKKMISALNKAVESIDKKLKKTEAESDKTFSF